MDNYEEVLKMNGYNVIYLGANVPLNSIKQVSETVDINNILFFSIANYSKENLESITNYLFENLSHVNRYLVSNVSGLNKLFKKNKIKLVDDIDKFIKLIS